MKLSYITWGDDSAEKDSYLLDYFVTSDAFRRIAARSKNLVIGRKGSGKSALLPNCSKFFRKRRIGLTRFGTR